ncbi:MAG TPA: DinB family protein [Spirochaetia bacterium]|nr:DinB family protein [Spirochaetia bacterium]
MAVIGMREMVEQVLGVLAEAFEGPHESWSYFTGTGKDGGLFGTLERLDAHAASCTLGRTSIAAHVNHVTFGLNASARWIEGDRTTHSLSESWNVSAVDEREWRHAREQLRAAYRDIRRVIELFAMENEEAMAGAVGALAHVAYHLGAIRQKISFLAVVG